MRASIVVVAVVAVGLISGCGEPGEGAGFQSNSTSSPTTLVKRPQDSVESSVATGDVQLPRAGEEQVSTADLAAVEVTGLDGDKVTVHVGPRPSGQPGLCVLDAEPWFPGEVRCFEPDSAGRLLVPISSELPVQVFIDPRVSRVVLQGTTNSEELTLYPVPGAPAARVFATRTVESVDYLELRDAQGRALDGISDSVPLPDGSKPAVSDVPSVEVTAIGGETVTVQVGPRPSNEPGTCVVGAFAGEPGQVSCFAPDPEGTVFFEILGDVSVAGFINPKATSAVLVSDDSEQQFPLQPVPGVPDLFLFAQKIPPDQESGSVRFLDASGRDIDTADADRFGGCAVFDEAVAEFGPMERSGNCYTPSFEQEPVVEVGDNEDFIVVEVPQGLTATSDDFDLTQRGSLVKIPQLTGTVTLTFSRNGHYVGDATFDVEDISSSISFSYLGGG